MILNPWKSPSLIHPALTVTFRLAVRHIFFNSKAKLGSLEEGAWSVWGVILARKLTKRLKSTRAAQLNLHKYDVHTLFSELFSSYLYTLMY